MTGAAMDPEHAPAAVWAVVVLYNPEADAVRRQHAATSPQVAGIVYYDNGRGRETLAQLGLLDRPEVRLVGDGENRGIAEALNGGLALVQAMTPPPAFALLLDQDSVPSAGMVAHLVGDYRKVTRDGQQVAAIGPGIFDALHGRLEGFGQAVDFRKRRFTTHTPDGRPFEVFYLITSGTLVPVALLPALGLMEASLFIDAVDFEWSFRARARGYRLLATYATTLEHRRGERLHRPLPGVGIRLHSTRRLFYMYRNHFRLCFRRYMPPVWKIRGLWYLLVRATLFILFVPGRLANLAAIARGTWEGLRLGVADVVGGPPPRLRGPG